MAAVISPGRHEWAIGEKLLPRTNRVRQKQKF
jgi:hypothetical protein